MKKILIMALLVTGLSSCTQVAQRNKLIIRKISDYKEEVSMEPYGRYQYQFDNTDLVMFSDSLYSIGDTLKISK